MEPPEEKVVRGGQVRELHLKGKGMAEADIAGLAEALEDNETLTTLDLEGNDAGSYGVESLARVLTVNDTLTHLNLKDNNVDDEGVRKLAEVRSLALAPTAPLSLQRALQRRCRGVWRWAHAVVVGALGFCIGAASASIVKLTVLVLFYRVPLPLFVSRSVPLARLCTRIRLFCTWGWKRTR